MYQLYLYQIHCMQVINPKHTVFYSIEKAIKTYRQFAQRRLSVRNIDITIDQLLVSP